MATRFVLQPAESELQTLADQSWERSDSHDRQMEREAFEAGAAIRNGEYTLANLGAILLWKSGHQLDYLLTNGSSTIRRALEVAASPEASTRDAMPALLALRGIDLPMALDDLVGNLSRKIHRARYQDLQALGQRRRDIQFYEEYLAYCRGLAHRGLIRPPGDLPGAAPLRALDHALTQWARNHPE
jgi:hypothetical protein